MSFEPGKVSDFLKVFEEAKIRIASFEGCEGLILLRDASAPNVFFTYSYWRSEHDLNRYRFSELFKKTWSLTKVHFNEAPVAWSLIVEEQVK